jgi:hypothetical protein
VKESPKFAEPCDNESSSIWSGSRIGTLYFGSPAMLPYVSAFIKTEILFIHQLTFYQSGFGGLGVACWPLVPNFAASNPAEAVGSLRAKNPPDAFLWREVKPSVPCRRYT